MTPVTRALLLTCLCAAGYAADPSIDAGVAAFGRGNYAEALRQLAPAAAKGDQQAVLYQALAQAATGHCEEALPALVAAAKSSNVDWTRLAGLSATRCYTSAGKVAEGLAMAEQLKLRFPSDADVLYVAAETEMKAFNDTTFAMFQRTPSSYRVHELSARIFETQNRFADAIAEYKQAIATSPDSPDLHFRLGRAMLLESHSPEALQAAAQAFREELKISPEDSGCEYQLGQIAQAQAQTGEARMHFQRALQLSPDFVSALVALAGSYSREQQYTQAIPLLTKAVQLQPDNEAAHYALLTAYRGTGQTDKARDEKTALDRLQKPPEGEFSEFLKKLGSGQPKQ